MEFDITEIKIIIPDNEKSVKKLINDISKVGFELICVVSLILLPQQHILIKLAGIESENKNNEELRKYNFKIFKKTMKDLRPVA